MGRIHKALAGGVPGWLDSQFINVIDVDSVLDQEPHDSVPRIIHGHIQGVSAAEIDRVDIHAVVQQQLKDFKIFPDDGFKDQVIQGRVSSEIAMGAEKLPNFRDIGMQHSIVQGLGLVAGKGLEELGCDRRGCA